MKNDGERELGLDDESLEQVTGGAQSGGPTMPRAEAVQWLKACAISARDDGRVDANMGDPMTPKQNEQAAIAACNAGVAKYLSGKK